MNKDVIHLQNVYVSDHGIIFDETSTNKNETEIS